MKVLDSIQHKGLHKFLLVEDGGEFRVLDQAINRQPTPVLEHMTEGAALAYWRRACLCRFYGVTHNLHDAERLADRRIATIFTDGGDWS